MSLIWFLEEFAPLEAVHLTQEQAEALLWATSALGEVRSEFDEVEFG